ncbi:hypothetical protein KAR91_25535 [Candidatus Pacearchaeota archaeon]|nr:hypothetical protein [Candidatus Pacearchaeota archaeon]
MAENNFNQIALASAARTATTNSDDQTNSRHKGCHIIIDVTVDGGGSLTPKIQGKDPLSGKYYDILVGSAISAVGTTILKVYPGLTASANSIENDIVPSKFRIVVTAGDANSMTYSVGVNLV